MSQWPCVSLTSNRGSKGCRDAVSLNDETSQYQLLLRKIAGMKIMIEVSIGELMDKMTILEIKLDNISDETKLANVHHEYNLLKEVYVASINETATLLELSSQLKNINAAIWRIEDDIRNLERS